MSPTTIWPLSTNATHGNTSGNWTSGEAGAVDKGHLFKSVYLGYLWLALIIGLPGNLLISIVYMAIKQKRTSDWFIFYLAVYDCAVCVFAVPLYLSIETGSWLTTGSDLACKLEQFTIFTSQFSSVSILGIIAVDRYLKICHPTKRSLNATQARNIGVATPFFAGGMACPILVWEGNIQGRYCAVLDEFRHSPGVKAHILLTFIFYLCMFFVVSFCYVHVIVVVRRRIRRHKENAFRRKHLMCIPDVLRAISNVDQERNSRVEQSRMSRARRKFSMFSMGSARKLSAISPWIRARFSLPGDTSDVLCDPPLNEGEKMVTRQSLTESKKLLDRALTPKTVSSMSPGGSKISMVEVGDAKFVEPPEGRSLMSTNSFLKVEVEQLKMESSDEDEAKDKDFCCAYSNQHSSRRTSAAEDPTTRESKPGSRSGSRMSVSRAYTETWTRKHGPIWNENADYILEKRRLSFQHPMYSGSEDLDHASFRFARRVSALPHMERIASGCSQDKLTAGKTSLSLLEVKVPFDTPSTRSTSEGLLSERRPIGSSNSDDNMANRIRLENDKSEGVWGSQTSSNQHTFDQSYKGNEQPQQTEIGLANGTRGHLENGFETNGVTSIPFAKDNCDNHIFHVDSRTKRNVETPHAKDNGEGGVLKTYSAGVHNPSLLCEGMSAEEIKDGLDERTLLHEDESIHARQSGLPTKWDALRPNKGRADSWFFRRPRGYAPLLLVNFPGDSKAGSHGPALTEMECCPPRDGPGDQVGGKFGSNTNNHSRCRHTESATCQHTDANSLAGQLTVSSRDVWNEENLNSTKFPSLSIEQIEPVKECLDHLCSSKIPSISELKTHSFSANQNDNDHVTQSASLERGSGIASLSSSGPKPHNSATPQVPLALHSSNEGRHDVVFATSRKLRSASQSSSKSFPDTLHTGNEEGVSHSVAQKCCYRRYHSARNSPRLCDEKQFLVLLNSSSHTATESSTDLSFDESIDCQPHVSWEQSVSSCEKFPDVAIEEHKRNTNVNTHCAPKEMTSPVVEKFRQHIWTMKQVCFNSQLSALHIPFSLLNLLAAKEANWFEGMPLGALVGLADVRTQLFHTQHPKNKVDQAFTSHHHIWCECVSCVRRRCCSRFCPDLFCTEVNNISCIHGVEAQQTCFACAMNSDCVLGIECCINQTGCSALDLNNVSRGMHKYGDGSFIDSLCQDPPSLRRICPLDARVYISPETVSKANAAQPDEISSRGHEGTSGQPMPSTCDEGQTMPCTLESKPCRYGCQQEVPGDRACSGIYGSVHSGGCYRPSVFACLINRESESGEGIMVSGNVSDSSVKNVMYADDNIRTEKQWKPSQLENDEFGAHGACDCDSDCDFLFDLLCELNLQAMFCVQMKAELVKNTKDAWKYIQVHRVYPHESHIGSVFHVDLLCNEWDGTKCKCHDTACPEPFSHCSSCQCLNCSVLKALESPLPWQLKCSTLPLWSATVPKSPVFMARLVIANKTCENCSANNQAGRSRQIERDVESGGRVVVWQRHEVCTGCSSESSHSNCRQPTGASVSSQEKVFSNLQPTKPPAYPREQLHIDPESSPKNMNLLHVSPFSHFRDHRLSNASRSMDHLEQLSYARIYDEKNMNGTYTMQPDSLEATQPTIAEDASDSPLIVGKCSSSNQNSNDHLGDGKPLLDLHDKHGFANIDDEKHQSVLTTTSAIHSTLMACIPSLKEQATPSKAFPGLDPRPAETQLRQDAKQANSYNETCETFAKSVFQAFFQLRKSSAQSEPCLACSGEELGDAIEDRPVSNAFLNQLSVSEDNDDGSSDEGQQQHPARTRSHSNFQTYCKTIGRFGRLARRANGRVTHSWFSLDDLGDPEPNHDLSTKSGKMNHIKEIKNQINSRFSVQKFKDFIGWNVKATGSGKGLAPVGNNLCSSRINVVITRCESLIMDGSHLPRLPGSGAFSLDPSAPDDSYDHVTETAAHHPKGGTNTGVDTPYSTPSCSESLLSRSGDTSVDRGRGTSLDLLSPMSASVRTGSFCSGLSSASRLTDCSAYTENSRSDCEKITRRSADREHNITKLLGVITFIFVISWSVSWVIVLITTLTLVPEHIAPTTEVTWSMARNLFLVNHFCNIIVYALLSKSFREKLHQCYRVHTCCFTGSGKHYK